QAREKCVDASLPALGGDHVVSVSLHDHTQRFENEWIVVDQENTARRSLGHRFHGLLVMLRCGGNRESQGDGGALAGCALDLDHCFVALEGAVDHRKPKASAPLTLGGKERLQTAAPDL